MEMPSLPVPMDSLCTAASRPPTSLPTGTLENPADYVLRVSHSDLENPADCILRVSHIPTPPTTAAALIDHLYWSLARISHTV